MKIQDQFPIGTRIRWQTFTKRRPEGPWHYATVAGHEKRYGAECHLLTEATDGSDLINLNIFSHVEVVNP